MAFMKKGAPPVSLSKIRNLATIIITVAKSKEKQPVSMVYSIHPGFTKSIEKKFTRFILYIKSDISMRSTIAHFVKILFPYQKGNYA
ncbi:hypothetical protein NXX91_14090 [Bacteroides thetaiotaomicron]|nr:hypothetical protein [Bacteroides thetaiotaomicron]